MDSLMPGLFSAPNLHPMVVHFPIAFWLGALLFWTIGVIRPAGQAARVGRWLLYLGTLGGLVAVAFGYWATSKMGHDTPGHDLVHVHRDWMLVTTGLAVALSGLAWWKRSAGRSWRFTLLVGLIALSGTLAVGADRGAELVFRYGMGTAGEVPPESDGHDHDHGEEAQPDHPHGADNAEPAPPQVNPGADDGHGAHDHSDHPH